MAYGAGGIERLERGKPFSIPSRSLEDLSTALTKAACIQAMRERRALDVPVSATGDPDMLNPFMRAAPAVLKPCLRAKRDEMRRDKDFNDLLDRREVAEEQEEALVRRNLPALATLRHDTINHGQEMGWHNLSNETKKTSRDVRQVEQLSQDNSQEPEPLCRQPKTPRWRQICNQAITFGIPRAAIQRQLASVTQSLLCAVQRHNPRENVPRIPNTPIQRHNSPLLPQNSRAKDK